MWVIKTDEWTNSIYNLEGYSDSGVIGSLALSYGEKLTQRPLAGFKDSCEPIPLGIKEHYHRWWCNDGRGRLSGYFGRVGTFSLEYAEGGSILRFLTLHRVAQTRESQWKIMLQVASSTNRPFSCAFNRPKLLEKQLFTAENLREGYLMRFIRSLWLGAWFRSKSRFDAGIPWDGSIEYPNNLSEGGRNLQISVSVFAESG